MTIEGIKSSNVVLAKTQVETSRTVGIPIALKAIDTGAGAILDFESSRRDLLGTTAIAGVDDGHLDGSSSPVDTASVASAEEAPKTAKTITLTSPRIQAAREIIENLASGDTKALEKNKAIIQKFVQEAGKSTVYGSYGEVEERGSGLLKKVSEAKSKNIFDNFQIALNISRELNAVVDILEDVQTNPQINDLFNDVARTYMDAQIQQAQIFGPLATETHEYRNGIKTSGELHAPAVGVTGACCFPFFRETFDAKLRKMKDAFDSAAANAGISKEQSDLIKEPYLEEALRLRDPAKEKIAVLSIAFGEEDPKLTVFVSGRKGMIIEDSGAKVVSFNW